MGNHREIDIKYIFRKKDMDGPSLDRDMGCDSYEAGNVSLSQTVLFYGYHQPEQKDNHSHQDPASAKPEEIRFGWLENFPV